jgi:phenylpyruvate tautomerase PptA (4-oxalocrotonate tautomerase family)
MPIVRVEIREGKSPEYMKAVLDGVHAALVEAFKIPDWDRMQLLYELPSSRFEAGHKSDNVTIVTITAFAGRSREAKKKLYSSLANRLSFSPGIAGSDLTIVLVEPPLEDWGIRGGKPADEADIGYDINV